MFAGAVYMGGLLVLYPAYGDVYDRIVAQGKAEFVQSCVWWVDYLKTNACSYAVIAGLGWMVFSTWRQLLVRIPSPERSHDTSHHARNETRENA